MRANHPVNQQRPLSWQNQVCLTHFWLYSSEGDVSLREPFETKMQRKRWRTQEESVKVNGRQIQPGHREYWYVAIRMQTPSVEECLNEVGVP
ncbi:MAG: hypothetical protein WCA35_05885 [Kovacikia sp.]